MRYMNRQRLGRMIIAAVMVGLSMQAVANVYDISVPDPATWRNDALSARNTGDTVRFSVPLIVNRNYGYGGFTGLTVSVRRIYSPTNQAIPGSAEYAQQLSLNSKAAFTLTGCGYHRNGERLLNCTGVITGKLTVQYVSGTWAKYNTRAAINHNPPSVDMNGTHNVLVCGANLEYYLVEQFDGKYGAYDSEEHQKQRTKVITALADIHADVYGLVEIQTGQGALREIAADLTEKTGTPYSFINDKSSVSGTYTKAGYVYRSDRLQPVGALMQNNTGVKNRKMIQGFQLIENGERFIYSINHFKAKSGSGTGLDADQGDGQGIYNHARVLEARSLLQNMEVYQSYYEDNDVLIMGDLNAYALEDPIRTLTDAEMYDLHRVFHADTSYSYVYGEQAGYLDHAIANKALIKQVTGMAAWHVNSDESDNYTYDKSNDLSIFRYSDHDPVLVGLRLDSTFSIPRYTDDPVEHTSIAVIEGETYLTNVSEWGEQYGYYELYDVTGKRVQGLTRIEDSPCPIATGMPAGIYVVRIYYAGKIKALKMCR